MALAWKVQVGTQLKKGRGPISRGKVPAEKALQVHFKENESWLRCKKTKPIPVSSLPTWGKTSAKTPRNWGGKLEIRPRRRDHSRRKRRARRLPLSAKRRATRL